MNVSSLRQLMNSPSVGRSCGRRAGSHPDMRANHAFPIGIDNLREGSQPGPCVLEHAVSELNVAELDVFRRRVGSVDTADKRSARARTQVQYELLWPVERVLPVACERLRVYRNYDVRSLLIGLSLRRWWGRRLGWLGRLRLPIGILERKIPIGASIEVPAGIFAEAARRRATGLHTPLIGATVACRSTRLRQGARRQSRREEQ